VNYTASDNIGLSSCWYSNDSYTKNTSLASCTTNISGATQVTWAEGKHNVTIWANDSAGNENSSKITFTLDTINPNVVITFPSNNTNISNVNLGINYTVSDTNLQSCWYSNDSYKINSSLSNCENITGVTWAEGLHNVTIWVNDSAGNVNNSKIYFMIDITPPVVYLKSPKNTTNTSSTGSTTFAWNITDYNGAWPKNATLRIWNSSGDIIRNTTSSYAGVSPDYDGGSIYTLPYDDIFLWNIYGCDRVDNCNWSAYGNFTITRDTIKPNISIVFPLNNTNTTNINLNINYTISDNIFISDCWYSNDSFTENESLANCGTNITEVTWVDGTHNVRVYVNDSAGNVNSSSVYFTIDTISPAIYLIEPLNNSMWNSSSNMVNFTYNVSDADLISNCSLILNGIINQTNITITRDINQTFNLTLANGNYNWSINCTDKLNNIGSSGDYNLTVSSSAAFSISLSQRLTQQINWSLASLPITSQHSEGNNGTGETFYWVNISVESGTVDLYIKASGDLMTSSLDILALGNEAYSYNSTNVSVPSDNKFSLTTDYADNIIGSGLTNGNVVYLKFFLSAPSGQAAGTYNNTMMFKAVPSGELP
jgi:hypothetical protein